ncbi:MAG: ATP-binding protein [Bacteroidales bacterium]
MIRKESIEAIINSQRASFVEQNTGLNRTALSQIPIANSYATIITGIRRCGKSTLLLQLLQRDYGDAIYLNFDDIRLSGFDMGDFIRLDSVIKARNIDVLFFDEIQIIKGWEKYINQLLREGYKVFITGSNASMLSVELGTHLTGRHLTMELFPFSFMEYSAFKGLESNEQTVREYLKNGGVPEYLKSEISTIITTLIDDILVRDIAVRHGVRDLNSLRQLTTYLITNIGNLVSANKLVGMFGIKSAATILEYFSYLKDCYLLEFVPMFNHSLKVQARNPKKVYVMDMGLYSQVAIATSENYGRRLENLVYLSLRRCYKQIFYYKNHGECDFITMDRGKIVSAIQVCAEVNDDNFDREYNGLIMAMQDLKLTEGYIVTLNQSDRFERDGMTVTMIPVAEFLLT